MTGSATQSAERCKVLQGNHTATTTISQVLLGPAINQQKRKARLVYLRTILEVGVGMGEALNLNLIVLRASECVGAPGS